MRQENSKAKALDRPPWAKRLTDSRKLTGMGPSEFSRKIGLSQQRYSNYERGEREPNISAWQRIISYLPVDLDFIIIGQSGPMDSDKNNT
jgi:transcriptional regulator with XRE-family HTH domain